ncbi:glutathione-dependent disulfide-bond oxidoreductase [Gammaproteobacteria bacterium]|nr:glutathione-dependent disulfide-bond oxidoreductase [Gammaproteobacteria bacterium]
MTDQKPALPADYVLPTVWQPSEMGGTFGKTNRPTAGPRFERELPRGEHDLQLYSLGTPNGQKVTILLEELGVDYDAWRIDIGEQDQFGSGFTAINPNSKIPAMVDYSQPEPLRVFESGSIMLYLADRERRFIPQDWSGRTECTNWLMWQMGTAPFIGGGFGHFYVYAPLQIEYAIDRYTMETKRILDVLNLNLAEREFVIGNDYSIADMAIMPWVRGIVAGYKAAEFVEFASYQHVNRWLDQLLARPAVARGLRVNASGEDAVRERHSAADFEVS